MNKNIGNIDRSLRIIIGLVVFMAGAYFKSLWGLVGIIPILTGIIRWCPAYWPFGVSTCKKYK